SQGEQQKAEGGDTDTWKRLHAIPTLAVGAGFHNITSTDDAWRADKLENALDAFFAREDFRDYYKLAGWDGYLAFRPGMHSELRAEWRSDHYDSLSQNVFYGRFGGDKVLPPNRPAMPGLMNSLVLQARDERVHTRSRSIANIWGDSVEIEQLKGCSTLAQVELGHMPGSDFGFNRYLLDGRGFWPLFNGFNFDARFRYEATTGDLISQKLEYLGGPSSLPALYNKSIVGNRMMLLNTEIRFDLEMLSSFFHSSDFNIVLYNDFGKMGIAGTDESIVQGFQFSGASSILYDYGIGLGWTNGIQIGATWRTDIKADPRWIFRLQRAF
ncbi:MAG TPA: BamA/TamA family outer membrane protein, partial [Candidatus Kapabacteria bacterium]